VAGKRIHKDRSNNDDNIDKKDNIDKEDNIDRMDQLISIYIKTNLESEF
jgi:hypothetical protein